MNSIQPLSILLLILKQNYLLQIILYSHQNTIQSSINLQLITIRIITLIKSIKKYIQQIISLNNLFLKSKLINCPYHHLLLNFQIVLIINYQHMSINSSDNHLGHKVIYLIYDEILVFTELVQSSEQQSQQLFIHIALTSKNIQLNNYLTGEWISIYKIDKNKIEGNITINAHIFETGNVQMTQQRKLEKQFEFTGDMDENALNIIKIVQMFQAQTQAGLSEVYEQMSTGFFKNLRRIAPITKTKMVWNVNALKMNKSLLEGKN